MTVTLLISSRHTPDNQALWRAAIERAWDVERVRGPVAPTGLPEGQIVLYVEPLFAGPIAEQLGLKVLEPAADWLPKLPMQYRRRDVVPTTLGSARGLAEPRFVKPAAEKSFEARVYACGSELPLDFDDALQVLVAEPVEFDVEYRAFVLDRTVRTLSPYWRRGRLAALDEFRAPDDEWAAARNFAEGLLADRTIEIPRAVALDIGHIRNRGWAVRMSVTS